MRVVGRGYVDAVRNLEVTFRSLGGGSKEKMQEDWNEKSAQKDTNTETLRAGCSKAEPKIFCPAGDAERQKFKQLEMVDLPSPTDPVWWRSMLAVSSYRGNRPTYIQTRTQTYTQTNPQTGPITIHWPSWAPAAFFPGRANGEPRPEGPRQGGVLGRAYEPPPHQLGGLGWAISSPSGGR